MIAEQKSLPMPLDAIAKAQAVVVDTENEPVAAAAPMDNSSTMFKPRSAAAMALSSISGRIAAVPPAAPQQKVLFAQLPVTKESPCAAAPPSRPVLTTQTSPPLHHRVKNAATMTNVSQESPPFTAQAPNYGENISRSTERKMVNAQRGGYSVMTGPTTLNSSSPLEPQYLSARQQQQRPSPAAAAPPRNVGPPPPPPPHAILQSAAPTSSSSYRAAPGQPHADFLPPLPPWTPPTWNQSGDYRHHHHHQYHPPPAQQSHHHHHHHHHPLSSSLGHNGHENPHRVYNHHYPSSSNGTDNTASGGSRFPPSGGGLVSLQLREAPPSQQHLLRYPPPPPPPVSHAALQQQRHVPGPSSTTTTTTSAMPHRTMHTMPDPVAMYRSMSWEQHAPVASSIRYDPPVR
jgi:hypothetical protein